LSSRRIYVLRLGHRPQRDKRISTHVGLVARAFGAHGIIYSGGKDENLLRSLRKVVDLWGGDFDIRYESDWREVIREWKERGGVVIHLTMYGENIASSDVLKRIKETGADLLIVVGAEKVPGRLFELADFNVAIGNQPHSEVAALALFLDRLYAGRELLKEFKGAKLRIVPQSKGKKVIYSLK